MKRLIWWLFEKEEVTVGSWQRVNQMKTTFFFFFFLLSSVHHPSHSRFFENVFEDEPMWQCSLTIASLTSVCVQLPIDCFEIGLLFWQQWFKISTINKKKYCKYKIQIIHNGSRAAGTAILYLQTCEVTVSLLFQKLMLLLNRVWDCKFREARDRFCWAIG